MEYPDNVIPHPNATEPPIANERIFAADRTLSNHGQHSLSQAFDALALISATDVRGRITYVNEGFVKISGYSEAELLGQSHGIVNSGHHPAAFFKQMWRTITAGETWQRAVPQDIYLRELVAVPVGSIAAEAKLHLRARGQKFRQVAGFGYQRPWLGAMPTERAWRGLGADQPDDGSVGELQGLGIFD